MSGIESYSNPTSDIVEHNGRQYRRNGDGNYEIVASQPSLVDSRFVEHSVSVDPFDAQQRLGEGVHLTGDQVMGIITQLAAERNTPHLATDAQPPSTNDGFESNIKRRSSVKVLRTVAKCAFVGILLVPTPHIAANLVTTQVVSLGQEPIDFGQALNDFTSDISSKFTRSK